MSTITGSGAGDILNGGPTTDLIEGLGGDDYIKDTGGDSDVIRGGDGADTIWVERSYTGVGGLITIEGGAGDDQIDATGLFHATPYDWRVEGGDGDDSLELRFLTHFTADLGAGNDYIYVDMPMSGGVISLGSGADRIAMVSDYGRNPGAGDRYLTINGLGADDQIDLIVFTYGMTNWDQVTNLFASGHLRATQSGADVLIDVDMDGVGAVSSWNPLLRLTDRTLAQLSPLNLGGMPLDGGPIGLTYTAGSSSYTYFNGTYGVDHLTAGEDARNVSLTGLAGDDVLVANSTGSGLWGGDGDDHLIGGAGNDNLDGGLGDDLIEGGGGREDTLYFMSWDTTAATFVLGKSGAQNTGFGWDTVTGIEAVRATANADHLSVDASMTGGVLFYASAGDDVLVGGVGDDSLYGEDGDDQVLGGDGDDTLDDFGDGADFYDGGAGYDTMSYSASDRGVAIDLTVTSAQAANHGELDFVLNMEALIGSTYADTLSGNDQANILWGYTGDDTLIGRGGDDELTGGGGNDYLDGGDGDDELIAGSSYGDLSAGDNTLIGGAGNNFMVGGGGQDTFVVGKGHDTIIDFQVGTDLISVDDLFVFKVSEMAVGTDEAPFYSAVYVTLSNGSELMFQNIRASDITDSIFTGLKSATLGGAAGDTLWGTAAGDLIKGLDGADRLMGAGGADLLDGGAGDDVLDGGADNDRLVGGSGADTLIGGAGSDELVGGAGDDTYEIADAGDAVVETAGEGRDVVFSYLSRSDLAANVESLVLVGSAVMGVGNAQDNTLYGNAQNNTLIGGAGADAMVGGAGNDTYEVTEAGDSVYENAGEGADVVFSYADRFALGANVESLVLVGSAVMGVGNAQANTLYGNALDNTLIGGAGNDAMVGGAGNDTYEVTEAGDSVYENAGEGVDMVFSYADRFALGANVETLVLVGSAVMGVGNAQANTLYGNALNNTLIGGAGDDAMVGGAGDDTYEVTETGDAIYENAGEGLDGVFSYAQSYTLSANVETLTLVGQAVAGAGNAQDNTLTGNALANILVGGAGNDNLNGGVGDDRLTGGVGNDTFWFLTASAGKDVITDFTDGVDRIIVDHALFADLAAVRSHAAQVGDNVVITYDQDTSLTLEHFVLANLTASDFLFA